MSEPRPYIVLIDDDEDDLEMLSSSLNLSGIKVKTFVSGEKALFYLTLMSGNAKQPVLIIMDYNMPVSNGQQILTLLKNNPDTRRIPVVIYSTSVSPILKNALKALGAYDCFLKASNYSGFTMQVNLFKDLAHSFISNKNLA